MDDRTGLLSQVKVEVNNVGGLIFSLKQNKLYKEKEIKNYGKQRILQHKRNL